MRNVLFATIVLLSGAEMSGQVRTWISPDGLDTNPCTRDQPCRSFAAGIGAVAPGGEVVAFESGGYGAVSVTKSVTLLAPAGVHAAIAPTQGTAIEITASDTDHVVVRNLYLNSQGADHGIHAITAREIHVEACVFHGFTSYGIWFGPTTPNARLHASHSLFRKIFQAGISVDGFAGGIHAAINSVRVHQSGNAVEVQSAEALVRNSVASGGSVGFRAEMNSGLFIEDSVATNTGIGFFANNGGFMTMTRCAATSNSLFGVRATGSESLILVSASTIVANATGISNGLPGAVYTRINNTVMGNGTNGSFADHYLPK